MTDTLFENRLSEMLPEHTNAGSAKKIKGTTWRRTMATDFAPPPQASANPVRQAAFGWQFTLIAGSFPYLESDLRGERNPSTTAGNRRDGEGSPEWPGNQKTVSRSGTTFQLFLCTRGQSGNAMASFYFQFQLIASWQWRYPLCPLVHRDIFEAIVY